PPPAVRTRSAVAGRGRPGPRTSTPRTSGPSPTCPGGVTWEGQTDAHLEGAAMKIAKAAQEFLATQRIAVTGQPRVERGLSTTPRARLRRVRRQPSRRDGRG